MRGTDTRIALIPDGKLEAAVGIPEEQLRQAAESINPVFCHML